jgi:hypothetical protein
MKHSELKQLIREELSNILKENEEEDGMKDASISSNYAIIPKDMGKALDAISNPDNYVDERGTYFNRNFIDRKMQDEIFGIGADHMKDNQARENWEKLSPTYRVLKLKDIQNREPELVKKGLEKNEFEKAYISWKEEGNEGSKEDFIINSGYDILKMVSKDGRYVRYYPIKTGQNLNKYGGALSPNLHYDIEGDKIIFPSEKIKVWGNKDLIKRRVKTIMNNAGVEFRESEKIDIELPTITTKPTLKPTASTTSLLTTTVNTADQADDLIKLFKNRLGKVSSAEYKVEPTGVGADRKYKSIVTGISADQRAKLQLLAFDFKKNLKEQNEIERHQMLVRAGIIK